MHAVELCKWLRREEFVTSDGQPTRHADGKTLKKLLPPSVHAVVQAQIDQMPTAPGVVLRCASVLGAEFSVTTLFRMLPAGVAVDEEALEEQLQLLDARTRLVAESVECDYAAAPDISEKEEGGMWQVGQGGQCAPVL
jgi:predicted ATPase